LDQCPLVEKCFDDRRKIIGVRPGNYADALDRGFERHEHVFAHGDVVEQLD
jgi:hypothetical protein